MPGSSRRCRRNNHNYCNLGSQLRLSAPDTCYSIVNPPAAESERQRKNQEFMVRSFCLSPCRVTQFSAMANKATESEKLYHQVYKTTINISGSDRNRCATDTLKPHVSHNRQCDGGPAFDATQEEVAERSTKTYGRARATDTHSLSGGPAEAIPTGTRSSPSDG